MSIYYGVIARISAIVHKIKYWNHNVEWMIDADEDCPEDIVCETCDHIFWCRFYDRV